jgi:hypothetical protein
MEVFNALHIGPSLPVRSLERTCLAISWNPKGEPSGPPCYPIRLAVDPGGVTQRGSKGPRRLHAGRGESADEAKRKQVEAWKRRMVIGAWKIWVEAVLSTCSTLFAPVNMDDSLIIQFSHFSVNEFLTSSRFADKSDIISRRYHISPMPAYTLVAQACLGVLLHLDKDITRDNLRKFPLAQYTAEHWFEHARFAGVSQKTDEGIKRLLDRKKPHLAVWVWMYDPTVAPRYRKKLVGGPLPPLGTSLHYAAFCGLSDVVKVLTIEHPQDIILGASLTILHLCIWL